MEQIQTEISIEMCNGIKTVDEMRKLCEAYNKQIVEIIKQKYKNSILDGKTPSEKPKLTIVGGQNASGKSTLITRLNTQNAVSIIIDDMKEHHPFRNYIDKNFPDASEELLHLACFEVFDSLLNELLQENYDVLIERTLGSKEKVKKFIVAANNNEYDIEVNVMGTHGINSLLSALERFMVECQLRDEYIRTGSKLKIDPRPISPSHHDDTYENIISVLQFIEDGGFGKGKEPDIRIWDRTPGCPTEIYSTKNKQFPNVTQAMEEARRRDLKRCQSGLEYGVQRRIVAIKSTLENAPENSTLKCYEDFCKSFLKLIEERFSKNKAQTSIKCGKEYGEN